MESIKQAEADQAWAEIIEECGGDPYPIDVLDWIACNDDGVVGRVAAMGYINAIKEFIAEGEEEAEAES